MQAYLAALGFAVLAIFFTPFAFLTGVIIALITLRVGSAEGLKTLAASIAAHLLLAGWLHGSYLPGLVVVIEFMLPVWVLALALRQTNSLGLTLQLAALIAGSAVVLAHLVIGDMQAWWLELFQQTILPLLDETGIIYTPEMLNSSMAMLTMLIAMFAVLLWFSLVLTARWLQSVLYYPGKFQEDFHELRLPRNLAYVMIAVAVLSTFFNDASGGLLGDLFGLFSVVLMFQGLAVIHHSIKVKSLHRGWLIAMYFLLFVFPQTVLVLAIIGLADQFSDFRNRWVQGK